MFFFYMHKLNHQHPSTIASWMPSMPYHPLFSISSSPSSSSPRKVECLLWSPWIPTGKALVGPVLGNEIKLEDIYLNMLITTSFPTYFWGVSPRLSYLLACGSNTPKTCFYIQNPTSQGEMIFAQSTLDSLSIPSITRPKTTFFPSNLGSA